MPTSSRGNTVRIVVSVISVVLVVFLGFAIRARTSGKPTQKAKAPRAVPVLIAKAVERDVPIWLEGLGTVSAWQQVTVHPQVDGRLDKIFFKEGQLVHKGEALAQIDPRPFQAQLDSAQGALARDRAQLHDAQLNLARYHELVAGKLISQQQVDDQAALAGQAEGAVQADQAQVETARLNLDYAHVRSPIDGVVGVRLVDAGNLVRATDATGLVVITELDPAALYVTVAEDALPEVSQALARGAVPVEVWSRDGATQLGSGQLYVIDNQINQATATLRLKCKVPNPKRLLWPNQFVKARLLVDLRKNAMVTQLAAVQHGPQGTFVYLVSAGDKAEMRPVKVALTTGEIAVIAEGLKPGDQVVVEGQDQLRPGAQVIARPGVADFTRKK